MHVKLFIRDMMLTYLPKQLLMKDISQVTRSCDTFPELPNQLARLLIPTVTTNEYLSSPYPGSESDLDVARYDARFKNIITL